MVGVPPSVIPLTILFPALEILKSLMLNAELFFLKPTTATLSGTFSSVSGLSQGSTLTLLLPRDTWSYTGQVGTLEFRFKSLHPLYFF